MPQFYHDIITEKSFLFLAELRKKYRFILIGGWAVYLYTKALKSKDIDIIIEFDQLSLFSKKYALNKNIRLKKYEARHDEVQIDIYLPHYSEIGLPVEILLQKTRVLAGFTVVLPEYLLVLKLVTLAARGRSAKGRKDFLDLVSLIQADLTPFETALTIVRKHRLESAW